MDHGDKNWNFLKFHACHHAFNDIKKKGASQNFGMKTSESMYGAVQNTYHKMTNFKDVTPQLVKQDYRRTVAMFIQDQIDAINEDLDAAEGPKDLEALALSNIDIGLKLKPLLFWTIEQAIGKCLRFDSTETIVPFQFLKVHYESLSAWTSMTDYLQCNPKFNGNPRYDCVLVEAAPKPFFARLLYLFSCMVEKKSHPFALILPLDALTGPLKRIDKALRFHQVQARKQTEFISVHSIICGAVLVPDFDKAGEFIVFDILDGDMVLQLKNLFPQHRET
ncbi:hypothetical protein C8R44DRAFT_726235 [Mycena epipterygia]|nr:hypothetical protein C8R44DRAFT_726235 [Mycena epipterygia]